MKKYKIRATMTYIFTGTVEVRAPSRKAAEEITFSTKPFIHNPTVIEEEYSGTNWEFLRPKRKEK